MRFAQSSGAFLGPYIEASVTVPLVLQVPEGELLGHSTGVESRNRYESASYTLVPAECAFENAALSLDMLYAAQVSIAARCFVFCLPGGRQAASANSVSPVVCWASVSRGPQ